jgi:hypothetical protein
LCVHQQESTTETKNASWECGFTKQPTLSVPRPASSVPQPLGTVSQQHDTPALLTSLYAMASGHSSRTKSKVSFFLCHTCQPRHTRRGVEPDFNQSPADNQAFFLGQTRDFTRSIMWQPFANQRIILCILHTGLSDTELPQALLPQSLNCAHSNPRKRTLAGPPKTTIGSSK